jgi:lycopene beta-cyclase
MERNKLLFSVSSKSSQETKLLFSCLHPMLPPNFDVLFAGAGLSGLTTALALAQQPALAHLRIGLVERDPKVRNDRTWCFWAKPQEIEGLKTTITRTWKNIDFFSPTHSERLKAEGYQYYMVRGADYYQWAKSQLAQCPNVEWIAGNVLEIDHQQGIVYTDAGAIRADWVLNSALAPFHLVPSVAQEGFEEPFTVSTPEAVQPPNHIHLLQHFKGWVIRTKAASFDPDTVTFMDFRVSQASDTRFAYVLPLSPHEALVEYTLFSPELLPTAAYSEALRGYMAEFCGIVDFEIVEEEFGIIPMSDYPFAPTHEGRTIHIGTAGGFVKPSSGYAFKRTQRRARAFAQDWARNGRPNPALLRSQWRYRAYDSVFLRALADGLVPAHRIFGDFFKNLGGTAVFRFLDEENTIFQDIRAMNAVPTWPFMQAAFRQMPALFRI